VSSHGRGHNSRSLKIYKGWRITWYVNADFYILRTTFGGCVDRGRDRQANMLY